MAIKTTVYQCETCQKYYKIEDAADTCCEVRYCEDCGAETPYKSLILCRECNIKKMFEKSRKMTVQEYIEEFPGYPIVSGDDTFVFGDEFDFEEFIAESEEGYCWGSIQDMIILSEDDAVLELEEHAADEEHIISAERYEEYAKFVKRWNEKYGQFAYWVDKKIAVISDKRPSGAV